MKRLARNLKPVFYLLLLFAITFISQAAHAATNNLYNGQSLYQTYCAACHDTGGGVGALPIVGVVGRGDDMNITKNAIINNKSRANIPTYMNTYSLLTNAQLQAIANYTYPLTITMPVPSGSNFFPHYFPEPAHETPVRNIDTASAMPIGVGNSQTVSWQIDLPKFAAPVDIIWLAMASNANGYILNARFNQQDDMNLAVTGEVPMSFPINLSDLTIPQVVLTIPQAATLTLLKLWVMVLPSGGATELSRDASGYLQHGNYYLWYVEHPVQ